VKKVLAFCLCFASAVACTASSDPVAMGPDTYIIAENWGVGGGASLKVDAYRKAGDFCHRQGKELMPVQATHSDSKWGSWAEGGTWASAEVQFRCLNPSDPELARPKERRAADIAIQTQ
jgi:hypothetical protein